jgi:hypothetical protein
LSAARERTTRSVRGPRPRPPSRNVTAAPAATSSATDLRTYDCSNGGSGATKTFSPVDGAIGATALPANDVVQSLDIVEPLAGTSTSLTNITVAGLTITDYRTCTAAGTIIG